MPSQVSLLFEVDDLSQASPATVSRTGMIYMNTEDLGWQPFVDSWLARKGPSPVAEALAMLVERYMERALQHKRQHCRWVSLDRGLVCTWCRVACRGGGGQMLTTCICSSCIAHVGR